MKTTIDIADGLLIEARDRAGAQGTTLRALVEEGLRRVLAEPVAPPGRRFEMPTWGDPANPDDAVALRRALAEPREERVFPALEDLA